MIYAPAAQRFLRVGPFAALALVFGGPVVVWLVYGSLRARYLRFAPGRIELLRCPLLVGRPRVTTFPLGGDTVLFIATGNESWRLAVCRPDGVFHVRFMTGRRESERIWHALLSTAPTPPLTYDSL